MAKTSSNDQGQKFLDLIEKSKRAVFFTGAGISTESGISDFRSRHRKATLKLPTMSAGASAPAKGAARFSREHFSGRTGRSSPKMWGLWQRFQPVTIQEFLTSDDKRREYWIYKKEVYAQAREAQPNSGHLAMAEIEKQGKARGVITQNIDGLHQKAGSKRVLELHGTVLEIICLSCQEVGPIEPVYERIQAGEEIPLCLKCQGFLKPNTISFGQMLDADVLRQASEWARDCDLMVAAGSTLVVEPAASIPRRAKEYGAALVIINRDPTPLDFMADLVVNAGIGAFLSAVSKDGRNT